MFEIVVIVEGVTVTTTTTISIVINIYVTPFLNNCSNFVSSLLLRLGCLRAIWDASKFLRFLLFSGAFINPSHVLARIIPRAFWPPPKPPPPKISASRNALTLKFSPVVDLDKRRQCTKFQVDDVTIWVMTSQKPPKFRLFDQFSTMPFGGQFLFLWPKIAF